MTEKITLKEKWTLGISAFSLFLFIVIILINIYRQELFGIIPGYASHNFAFNMSFFLPANLIILLLSFAMFARTLKNWKNWKNMNRKLAIFFLTLPILFIWILQIVRLFYFE